MLSNELLGNFQHSDISLNHLDLKLTSFAARRTFCKRVLRPVNRRLDRQLFLDPDSLACPRL